LKTKNSSRQDVCPVIRDTFSAFARRRWEETRKVLIKVTGLWAGRESGTFAKKIRIASHSRATCLY